MAEEKKVKINHVVGPRALLPMSELFDQKFTAATVFLSCVTGKKMSYSITPSRYLAYFLRDEGKIWLDPQSFAKYNPGIEHISFYSHIGNRATEDGKILCEWKDGDEKYTAELGFMSRFVRNKFQKPSSANLDLEIHRLNMVKSEIIGILKGRNINMKHAHHGSDQDKHIVSSRDTLSYRYCDLSQFASAETKVEKARKDLGFELPGSSEARKGKDLAAWEALRYFTVESYLLCIESIDKILDIMIRMQGTGQPVPEGCEIWDHVVFCEGKAARKIVNERTKVRYADKMIYVRCPAGPLCEAMHTSRDSKECFICDAFFLFRAEKCQWNLMFETEKRFYLGSDHKNLQNYKRFVKLVDQKFDRMTGRMSDELADELYPERNLMKAPA